ncbi:hypothetical protein [Mesorhizobium sp. BR-1-1-10]|uniref:hypothetical protein n=1 Tax=Mesorhizobium sp. BR-1-1-10 TaxID=2876660 RepID=UPI001CD14B16|nr:hypothetical protein [Mesorhizobium sp. BR-1-1-10]MBZ9975514.1 hypothetical protein [Mesorhizobium sp. BR-1-1-10]
MERPIILKAHEVRGILENRQTQLRRVVKPAVVDKHEKPCPADYPHKLCNHTWPGKRVGMFCPDCYQALIADCPHGQPGDRLWVREAFGWKPELETDPSGAFSMNKGDCLVYREGSNLSNWELSKGWCPSIHMPRWASRILLEIVSVRVERLQDISQEDAVAEGATSRPNCQGFRNASSGWSLEWPQADPERHALGDARMAFANLMCRLDGGKRWNLKPTCIWTDNPWVWVVEFKRVEA